MSINPEQVLEILTGQLSEAKATTETPASDNVFKTHIAPSLRDKTTESKDLTRMDNGLQRIFSKVLPTDSTSQQNLPWQTVQGHLENFVLLEPFDVPVNRSDVFTTTETNWFKFDGSPDQIVVKKVIEWVHRLIDDPDVLETADIDVPAMAQIVSQSGATVDSIGAVFHKNEEHQKSLVDITGVLRYPDVEKPHFKLYNLSLTAWSKSERTLFFQQDTNGITGQFRSQKYCVRQSVWAEMSDKAKESIFGTPSA